MSLKEYREYMIFYKSLIDSNRDINVMNKNRVSVLILLPFLTLLGCTAPKSEIKGKVASASEQSCINEFKALKNIDPASYEIYQQQFSKVNQAYEVYRTNSLNVNKDSKEILGMQLNNKLKLICARVKDASFKNMEKRSQEINSL